MARYLIQSGSRWQFLHSSPVNGDVTWTPSLRTAMEFGVIDDLEQVHQLIEDHCDFGDSLVIDLDREYD